MNVFMKEGQITPAFYSCWLQTPEQNICTFTDILILGGSMHQSQGPFT